MSLTYLDSVMIENPASFQDLSSVRLSADFALIKNLDISNIELQGFTSTGTINTVGLSTQSLSAGIASFTNLTVAGVSSLSSFRTLINNGNVFTVGLSVQRLSADNASINNAQVITGQTGSFQNLNVQNLTATNFNFSDIIFGEQIANSLYVSVSGNDNNTGRNIFEPLRTIKKACEIAHNALNTNSLARFTIFVGTGDYVENNPIFVPRNTSLIGDNLRRVSVFPGNPNNDILWCNNTVYVWGFTFRGHKNGAAATAFPNFSNPTLTAIALQNLTTPTSAYNFVPALQQSQGAGWKKPYIVTSPYIQGCSSITNATGVGNSSAGCGMRIDGSLAEGYLRSFVLDSYTQFNEGGKGLHIINNGYAQLVSIFTICCTEGVHAESGGSCSINTSNCSFGLSGLVATGKSLQPTLTGQLVSNPANTSEIRITQSSTGGTVLYPDSIAPSIANAPYNGLVFTIGGNSTVHIIEGNPFLENNEYVINTVSPILNTHSPGDTVNFYIRSTISTSSHTFEYIGSGITLADAVPARGGVSITNNEALFDDVGRVFFTSTNQAGNFRVGNEFTILQETGTIEGDTFKRAILTLVTPLVLSLE
jgi:hypothetical protein